MSTNLSTQLTHWLVDNLSSFPPAGDVIAFNVGLLEVEDGFCAYLMGSTKYDSDDDDWAVSPSYKPDAKYFSLPRAAYDFKDWQVCQERVMSAILIALTAPAVRASPIGRASAVTVGFDDGDLHRIK